MWLPADETRWEAFLSDDEPPELAFYCPDCANREFGNESPLSETRKRQGTGHSRPPHWARLPQLPQSTLPHTSAYPEAASLSASRTPHNETTFRVSRGASIEGRLPRVGARGTTLPLAEPGGEKGAP